MRVVDWLELQKTFPTELKVELRKTVSADFDQKLHSVLTDLYKCIEAYTEYIDMTIDLILARAQEQRIKVSVYSAPCGRGCTTCLGKYSYHYPYLREKAGGRWRQISTRRLYEFCLRLRLTEKQVRMFDRAIWARHKLIGLFHGIIITLNHLGITAIELEAKPKQTQIQRRSKHES